MNAQCTGCETVYRVDPRKVPPHGVRARCSTCGDVILVQRASEGADEPAHEEQPLLQRHKAAAVHPPPQAADGGSTPSIRQSPQEPAPGSRGGPRFGSHDPHARAQRLARALVSDMITYHPERQQRGLQEGTLRQEFRDEIRKSWEEYVEQIGREVAHGTPYFRDALNQILARGQQVF